MVTPGISDGIALFDVRAAGLSANAKDDELRNACTQFEGMLFGMLFKTMRASLPNDGLIPQSNAEQLFQGMLDDQYALQLAQGQPAGVGAALYAQFRDGVQQDASQGKLAHSESF